LRRSNLDERKRRSAPQQNQTPTIIASKQIDKYISNDSYPSTQRGRHLVTIFQETKEERENHQLYEQLIVTSSTRHEQHALHCPHFSCTNRQSADHEMMNDRVTFSSLPRYTELPSQFSCNISLTHPQAYHRADHISRLLFSFRCLPAFFPLLHPSLVSESACCLILWALVANGIWANEQAECSSLISSNIERTKYA
jgi:hypothetical protein